MTNIEKIMFDAKYSVKFMNGIFVISAFNHIKSLQIDNDKFESFLKNEDLAYYDEDDWDELVREYKN
jgi:hypothetical protein